MLKINMTAIKKPHGRFLTVSQAAEILQVSPDTLRNWERRGTLIPARTPGGARRYSSAELNILKGEIKPSRTKRKGMLSVSRAATELQISKDTLRNWERKRLIGSYRTKGGARRFSREEISRIQKELGIVSLPSGNLNFTNESPKFSGHRSKIFTFSLIFSLITAILLSTFIYLKDSKDNQNASSATDILGAKNQDLENQLYQAASSLEDLRRQILNQVSNSDYKINAVASDILPSIKRSLENGLIKAIKVEKAELASQLVLGEVSLWSGDGVPSGSEGKGGDFYLRSDGEDANSLYYKTSANNWLQVGAPHTQNFQSIYEAGSDINTLNAGNINFVLTDTADDATFSISLLGDQSNFRINDGSLNDQTPFIINSFGNVGIGFSSPGAKVDIYQDTSNSDVDIFRILTNAGGIGNVKFRIDSDGDIFTDGSQTIAGAADIAENYPVKGKNIEEGEVMVIDGNFAERSAYSYQQSLIGVVSTKPGIILSGETEGRVIALAGKVPVKVSTENGSIEAGDYLTSSSIPGIAMKATRAGPTLGKALEAYDNPDPQVIEKILVFINISFADPQNILTSLSIDQSGNLLMPGIKVGSLILDESPAVSYDLSGKIASLEDEQSSLTARIKVLEDVIANPASPEKQSTTSGETAISSASAQDRDDVAYLNLTPPETLLATGSAQLASLTTSEATVSGKLTAYDLDIQNGLKSLGETTLGKTTIAGDLTLDGTLSVENGSEINVIGTLYLQKSLLADKLDIFDGKVTIDKEGNISAQTVIVAQFKVVAKRISGNAVITKGKKDVTVENKFIKKTSRILITPTTVTNVVLAVTEKADNQGFTVSASQVVPEDTAFDWFIIGEVETDQ